MFHQLHVPLKLVIIETKIYNKLEERHAQRIFLSVVCLSVTTSFVQIDAARKNSIKRKVKLSNKPHELLK